MERLLESRLGQQNRNSDIGQLWAQIAANRNEGREARGYDSAHRLTDTLTQNLSNMESLRVSQERQRMKDEARQREAKDRRKSGMMSFLGQLGGAGLGAMFGGPAGAQVGAGIGGSAGGWF